MTGGMVHDIFTSKIPWGKRKVILFHGGFNPEDWTYEWNLY